jgi:hypothetical protein
VGTEHPGSEGWRRGRDERADETLLHARRLGEGEPLDRLLTAAGVLGMNAGAIS